MQILLLRDINKSSQVRSLNFKIEFVPTLNMVLFAAPSRLFLRDKHIKIGRLDIERVIVTAAHTCPSQAVPSSVSGCWPAGKLAQ